MERIFEYLITEKENGLRVADFLRSRGYSHHILTTLKKSDDGICLNGVRCYATAFLKPLDRLTVILREETPSERIQPVPMDLKIVYEDPDLLVVDKPADTPTHPSFQNHGNTLANGLAWYFQEQKIPFVYRCINRLDRDTTGLLIIAKHMLSGSILSDMVKNRKIHREYLALADGLVPDTGTIDAPIGRMEGSALARCIDFEHGERAVTHFQRLAFHPGGETENGCSLVSLELETGRTHQIRVHMKYLGHPLPGDFLYHPDYSHINRQALHSHRLTFSHPITGEALSFCSPMPRDMEEAFYSF
ncbi:MAG: RluA family pseudouridine synthase [Candidatus Limivivens sp.]|nr:RluA family pseudouridine synthase [Candidatus Limivivens sp.]